MIIYSDVVKFTSGSDVVVALHGSTLFIAFIAHCDASDQRGQDPARQVGREEEKHGRFILWDDVSDGAKSVKHLRGAGGPLRLQAHLHHQRRQQNAPPRYVTFLVILKTYNRH